MGDNKKYYQKISAKNKSPEEVKKIEKLFNDNINIAHKVASNYYRTKYWDYDEALQIAKTGLWKACLIYDPEKYRISTLSYAVIHRDFMDYDKTQKKQPKPLFNLEDNVVTDDLSLADILVDEEANVSDIVEEKEDLKILNEKILKVLDSIAEDLKINKSIVKLVYLVHVESSRDNLMNMKSLNFIPRAEIKAIISELQQRLMKVL